MKVIPFASVASKHTIVW